MSVMGIQSSGKLTLLNTMFGVQMRTNLGQCTRGVNTQLLAVEGRPEYDYILLLDTEGLRAPEYHGLPDSEKRDNQMATLSILLADATIVVNPAEVDAAIKEILPVVLMAFQGSKLAEDNGDRLSRMMFFVYNRIDTTQKDKMSNIIQSLASSLDEAFCTVRGLTIDDASSSQKKIMDASESIRKLQVGQSKLDNSSQKNGPLLIALTFEILQNTRRTDYDVKGGRHRRHTRLTLAT